MIEWIMLVLLVLDYIKMFFCFFCIGVGGYIQCREYMNFFNYQVSFCVDRYIGIYIYRYMFNIRLYVYYGFVIVYIYCYVILLEKFLFLLFVEKKYYNIGLFVYFYIYESYEQNLFRL